MFKTVQPYIAGVRWYYYYYYYGALTLPGLLLLWFGPRVPAQLAAQIPLAEVYNDARRNVTVAITIAGKQRIPEVCLFFCNRLLRANRAVKVDR